jgi:predicted membrane GTPase involved in stress response
MSVCTPWRAPSFQKNSDLPCRDYRASITAQTTLVDQLFRQSGTFRDNQRIQERAWIRRPREGAASPSSPNARRSVGRWHVTHINIVTPATPISAPRSAHHSMVDGVILLVDAAEG